MPVVLHCHFKMLVMLLWHVATINLAIIHPTGKLTFSKSLFVLFSLAYALWANVLAHSLVSSAFIGPPAFIGHWAPQHWYPQHRSPQHRSHWHWSPRHCSMALVFWYQSPWHWYPDIGPPALVHSICPPHWHLSPWHLSPSIGPRALVPRALVPRALVPQALVPRALVPRALVPRALVPPPGNGPPAMVPQAMVPPAIVPLAFAPVKSTNVYLVWIIQFEPRR